MLAFSWDCRQSGYSCLAGILLIHSFSVKNVFPETLNSPILKLFQHLLCNKCGFQPHQPKHPHSSFPQIPKQTQLKRAKLGSLTYKLGTFHIEASCNSARPWGAPNFEARKFHQKNSFQVENLTVFSRIWLMLSWRLQTSKSMRTLMLLVNWIHIYIFTKNGFYAYQQHSRCKYLMHRCQIILTDGATNMLSPILGSNLWLRDSLWGYRQCTTPPGWWLYKNRMCFKNTQQRLMT